MEARRCGSSPASRCGCVSAGSHRGAPPSRGGGGATGASSRKGSSSIPLPAKTVHYGISACTVVAFLQITWRYTGMTIFLEALLSGWIGPTSRKFLQCSLIASFPLSTCTVLQCKFHNNLQHSVSKSHPLRHCLADTALVLLPRNNRDANTACCFFSWRSMKITLLSMFLPHLLAYVVICFLTLFYSFCSCCCRKQVSDFKDMSVWHNTVVTEVLWVLYLVPRMLSSSWGSPADLLLQLGCLVLSGNPVFIERCWLDSYEIRKPEFLSGVAELDENICAVPLKTLK